MRQMWLTCCSWINLDGCMSLRGWQVLRVFSVDNRALLKVATAVRRLPARKQHFLGTPPCTYLAQVTCFYPYPKGQLNLTKVEDSAPSSAFSKKGSCGPGDDALRGVIREDGLKLRGRKAKGPCPVASSRSPRTREADYAAVTFSA